MKTEIKEVYKCEHCNRLYQRKHHCLNHELGCKKRPDYLRPCHNCKLLKKVKATAWDIDEYGDEYGKVVDVLFCEKLDCFIYPPSVAAKGNAFEMERLNVEMPKECEFYLEKKYDDIPEMF